MYQPAQRIKYAPSPGQWPTAEEADRSLLFRPLAVGRLRLEQRTWVPAMVPWRATEQGYVTDEVLAWYRRFASGRPGALVVEATGIRDVPSGPLLRIGDDRFIPGLRELVRTVRESSGGQTRLLIQILDFLTIRRRPDRKTFLGRYLRITDRHRAACGCEAEDEVRRRLLKLDDRELAAALTPREMESLQMGYRERVTDVDLPHILDLPKTLPRLFAAAAVRAEQAGFDGVELHYAHAYTMASFLSALNTRQDGYGGSRENRVRLPLEVFRAVRSAVPDRFVVGCRYLTEDSFEGGSTLQDGILFAAEAAREGMDFLSLSRGGKFEDAQQPKIGKAAYPYTGPSGYECMPSYISDERGPFGRNVEPSRAIRAHLRAAGYETPVIVTGGIHGFGQAQSILACGAADVIGAARQSLADPDWFLKTKLGRGQDVRVCEYTNYCEGLDQTHKQVTCKLWDRLDLDEPNVAKTRDGRRRLTPPIWRP